MKHPEEVRAELARVFANRSQDWLRAVLTPGAAASFSLEVSLKTPSEEEALKQISAMQTWITAWQHWRAPETLTWVLRRWQRLGTHRLPHKLIFTEAAEIAALLLEEARWGRARRRCELLVQRWPELWQELPRHYEELAAYPDAEFEQLTAVLTWMVAHPASNLSSRQVPVAGVDTKWIGAHKGLLSALLTALRPGDGVQRSFYELCGLRPPPCLLRLRLLDPALRRLVGGLGDITAPVEELAKLDLPLTHALIVENVQPGLAFGDRAGTVVLMGMGYAVDVLAQLPWLLKAHVTYWGDLDTHGFAILHRARTYLPLLGSMLMNEATLLRYRELWTEERQQHSALSLNGLSAAEQRVYSLLKEDRLGCGVRLEQERIPWEAVLNALDACGGDTAFAGAKRGVS